MHASWLVFVAVLMAVCFAQPASATVDAGVTAQLVGTGQDGRIAIVAETSVQEDCEYVTCVVYMIDTHEEKFIRRYMLRIESRFSEIRDELCGPKPSEECKMRAHKQLSSEVNGTASPAARLRARYLGRLSVWKRALLGPFGDPPPALYLKTDDGKSEARAQLSLVGLGPGDVTLSLRERWTVPSFRSVSEDEQMCDPAKVSGCQQEERWEDGARRQFWVCTRPETGRDCSGRASMVRVEATAAGKLSEGRSSYVEPGALMQAALGLVKDHHVTMNSLEMAPHSLKAYRLPGGVLFVGGFAHGMYANGSWFPLVVVARASER